MNIDDFQEIVKETLEELPDEFKTAMENVGILIENWPRMEDFYSARAHPNSLLFGLYIGIPKTKRGDNYYGVLPDRIKIFAGPILLVSKDVDDAKRRIRKVVLHELGHHFGLSDERIYAAQGN